MLFYSIINEKDLHFVDKVDFEGKARFKSIYNPDIQLGVHRRPPPMQHMSGI